MFYEKKKYFEQATALRIGDSMHNMCVDDVRYTQNKTKYFNAPQNAQLKMTG